mmetsp:Transcript_19399/g.39879  ORF Transcript_19399/g.39879 Transcript_19399/m.39879 type:complete len:99 (-) Transcript_19399:383-679(-)
MQETFRMLAVKNDSFFNYRLRVVDRKFTTLLNSLCVPAKLIFTIISRAFSCVSRKNEKMSQSISSSYSAFLAAAAKFSFFRSLFLFRLNETPITKASV